MRYRPNPASEGVAKRTLTVDDCDQLEVGVTDGNDSIGGTPFRMSTSFDRRQAVPLIEDPRTLGEIRHGDQYMIEFERHGAPTVTEVATRRMGPAITCRQALRSIAARSTS
jgi:hypothetical protein